MFQFLGLCTALSIGCIEVDDLTQVGLEFDDCYIIIITFIIITIKTDLHFTLNVNK